MYIAQALKLQAKQVGLIECVVTSQAASHALHNVVLAVLQCAYDEVVQLLFEASLTMLGDQYYSRLIARTRGLDLSVSFDSYLIVCLTIPVLCHIVGAPRVIPDIPTSVDLRSGFLP